MNKLKLFISLIAAGALVVLGAFLPVIVSTAQDNDGFGTPGAHDVTPVDLHIRRDNTALAKLSLLKQGGFIPLSIEQTSIGSAYFTATAEALDPYVQIGLIPGISRASLQETAYLSQNPENRDHFGVFWDCYAYYEGTQGSISATIDDETGKLLGIGYYTFGKPIYGEAEISELLDAAVAIYFRHLGIENYADYETDQLSQSYSDYVFVDEVAQIRAFVFPDETYGEVRVEFVMHGRGFYTAVS